MPSHIPSYTLVIYQVLVICKIIYQIIYQNYISNYMLVVYQVLVIYKNQKHMILFARVEARQKFDFPVEMSWFLCNTNSNYFCRKDMTSC